jgi:hypothetical protein
MSNLYLLTKIAPITDAHKDGRIIYAYPDGNPISWNSVAKGWQKGENPDTDFNTGEFYVYKHEPTHYLPDGLPDPSAAVEVFEAKSIEELSKCPNIVEVPMSKFPEGTKVGVFKL